MATNVGSIYYDLSLDTKKFDKQAQSIRSKAQGIGKNMTSVGKKMSLGLTLTIVAFGALAIKSASNLEETINKVDVAFGKSAEKVKAWAKTTIDSYGMAGSTAMESASLFGDMGTSMGIGQEGASEMSMSLTGLAGDLASFKNIGIDQATTALAGVFTGETESLKKMGIVMTQVQLEEFAMAQGMGKTMKEMTQAEKVQLRYAFVMDKTKNAQGDFSRTSEGTANQLRISGERFKELREEIGTQLLPVANKILGWVQDIIAKFSDMSPKTKQVILIIAGLTAILGPLLIVLGGIATAVSAISLPVLLVIAGIALFIGAMILLEKKTGFVSKVFGWLKKAFEKTIEVIKVAWHWFEDNLLPTIKKLAKIVVEQLKKAWDEFSKAMKKAWEAIKPIMPILKKIAIIIGVVVLVAIGLVVGAIVLFVAIIIAVIVVGARIIGWLAKFGVMLWGLVTTIKDFVVGVFNTWVGMWETIISTMIEWGGKIITWFTELPEKLLELLSTAVSWLIDIGKDVVTGFIDGVKAMADAVWEAIKFVVQKIWDFYSGVLTWLFDTGKKLITGMIDGIKAMADAVWDGIKFVVQKIWDFYSGVLTWLFETGVKLITGLVDGIKSMAGALWDGIKFVADKIGKFYLGIGTWLFDSGKALIQGFIDGIKNMAGAIGDAIGSAMETARSFLPFSPAKKGPFSGKGWTLYSGMSLMAGFAEGIKRNSMLPQLALDNSMNALDGNISIGGSGGAQTNNTSIYGDITIGSETDSDHFFKQLSRNEELATKGLASRTGTV
ncbi:MAG: hypothetical protein DRR04_10405 [Gammaproteobacteria bacterium]|nr:MAG: hypothetical protein DRR04_10405 [Gammaproteobacteria bacterium]